MADQEYDFTLTRDPNSAPGVESYIMRPKEHTEHFQGHTNTLTILEDLVSRLPDLDYKFDEKYSPDYPVVPDRFLTEVGKFYHIRRPVFFIGGVAFFRRYNDDWNSSVVYSTGKSAGRVSWFTDMGSRALTALRDLVVEKGAENVTYDEVQNIIRG